MDQVNKLIADRYSYNLTEMLGQGAFSQVFKGFDTKSQETVAIKVISMEKVQADKMMIQFINNEISILKRISREIQNKHIIKIFDCLQSANNIYIILEYCNSGTLDRYVRNIGGILSEKQSLQIIFQIALAFKDIHKLDVAHRDVKPDNIFIKDDIFKLGDFGFASQKSIKVTQLGTPTHMAPEIFEGLQYSCKADIWSLGIMLHEMLFGDNYFIANSYVELANKVMKLQYRLDDLQKNKISQQCQDLLNRCLTKNPSQRISAEEIVNHEAFKQINQESGNVDNYSNQQNKLKSNQFSEQQLPQELQKYIDDCNNKLEACQYLIYCSNYLVQNLNESKFAIYFLLWKANFLMNEIFQSTQSKIQQYQEYVQSKQFVQIIHKIENNSQILDIFHNFTKKFVQFIQTCKHINQDILKVIDGNATSNNDIYYQNELKAKLQSSQSQYKLFFCLQICYLIDSILKSNFDFMKFNQIIDQQSEQMCKQYLDQNLIRIYQ